MENSPTAPTATEPTRSSICPWFEDGNIVLQAENTLFRVHRGILSLHSSVFRDMFALPPSAEDSSRMVEGCVVVHLHDKADEVGYMINALYGVSSCGEGKADKIEFAVVAGTLRLGTKYMISRLRKDAIATLRPFFPTTLHDFDLQKSCLCFAGSSTLTALDNDVLAVELLSEHQLLSLLPVALYELCCYSFQRLVFASDSLLSVQNLRTAIAAKENLALEYASMVDAVLSGEVSKSCENHGDCDGPMLRLRIEWDDPCSSEVLHPGSIEYGGIWSDFGICDKCAKQCVKRHDKIREDLWERLPQFFGLPGWDELREWDAENC